MSLGGDRRLAAAPAGEAVSERVERLSGLVQSVRRELHFDEDVASGRTVITVIDSESREIIRRIAPEDVPALLESLASRRGVAVADLRA